MLRASDSLKGRTLPVRSIAISGIQALQAGPKDERSYRTKDESLSDSRDSPKDNNQDA